MVNRMSGHILQEQNSRTALTVTHASVASKTPQYLAAALATLGALCAGTFMGYTSPALPLLENPTNAFPVSKEEGSWISALLNLGAALGAIPAGAIASRVGPKTLVASLTLPFLVSWSLIAYSDSVYEIYLGRLLAGFAVGATSVAAPLYVSEIAESRVRGALGSLFQLQLTAGILLAYLAGTSGNHRAIALICGAVPLIHILPAALCLPESPAFLLARGRTAQAERALCRLRGRNYDCHDELTATEDAIKLGQSRVKPGFKELLRTPATRRALVASLGLMTFQQWSGINAVLFYAHDIFTKSESGVDPNIATIIIGVMQVLATGLSTLLVDGVGRRALLLFSAVVMSVCLSALAAHQYLPGSSWLPLASVGLFVVAFSIGMGPVPWILLGELFSPEVKPIASSIAATTNWLQSFAVTKVFPNLTQQLGVSGAFWLFAGSCAAATAFVAVAVPETRGRSLNDIQTEMRGAETRPV